MKKVLAVFLLVINTQVFSEDIQWGGFHISERFFSEVQKRLPENGVILELGSGWGTGQLAKIATVYSVEHDKKYLNLYDSHYIYAPIKKRWYSVSALTRELPEHYDIIIVDGPPSTYGRLGFYSNLDIFRKDVPIFFDDVHRHTEFVIAHAVANALGKKLKYIHEKDPVSITGDKAFAIIE